jgi:3-oxoacyl-[acyl-carrier protein] reductase
MITLKNKVSIITGGSRGIGAATALMLAKAGSDIAINYVENGTRAASVVEGVQREGRRIITHQGNVGKSTVARDFVETVIAEYGRIDIVVNNAGIWTHGEIGATTEEVWDETLDINLKGVFNVCNVVVPYLKKNGGGRIINISSTAGQRGEAFHAHYAASKGGILAFTKSLSAELAPFKILVNSVAPGWVDTEMNEEVFSDPAFREQVINAIPLKKIATAEDVAGAVVFLASDLANHITGATINVNGGSVLN